MPQRKNRKRLSAEELAWFELALQLRMPVEELQNRITYSEFLDWQEFLELKRTTPGITEYYLAQIAFEVRRSFVKDPNKVKFNDFILKFAGARPPQEAPPPRTKAYKEYRVAMSKASWFAAIGFNPEAQPNG